ncbi:MAG: DUF1684 domain-containing protein [Blastocatellia bacterium]|nr:DUF1684 domain-containing protein [Blastocatellia bacterium]
MKKRTIVTWFGRLGPLFLALVAFSCSAHEAQPIPTNPVLPALPARTEPNLTGSNPLSDPQATPEKVTAALKEQRAAKDYSFKNYDQSPIPAAIRPTFTGLTYFPIDLNFRFICHIKPVTTKELVEMPASKGELRKYRRFGTFEFTIAGQTQKLTGFKTADATPLETALIFIPFKDATAGKETYGAGRYLELEQNASGTYVLDFNRAYHPFCLYNPDFSCPLPPAENILKTAIPAGEKLPNSNQH